MYGAILRSGGAVPGIDAMSGLEARDARINTDTKSLDAFTDTEVRHGFIRKVYAIVGVQLLMTILIASGVIHLGSSWIPAHTRLGMYLMFVSLAGSIGTLCVFQIYPDVMRRPPTNYLIMLLFTVCESVMIGFACSHYALHSILTAFGIVAAMVISLTLFSCQTRVDFTGIGPYLSVGSIFLLGFAFDFVLGTMLGYGGSTAFITLSLVYSCMGALLFSFYIIFHTQLIVSGKHRSEFNVDDYVVAAINLYIDIIQPFLIVLQSFLVVLRLTGGRR